MKFLPSISTKLSTFLVAFALIVSGTAYAQTAGSTAGGFTFNTAPFGGQLGQLDNGSFGAFGGNDQWIGLGQPNAFPGGPAIPAYGLRIQWLEQLATFSLNEVPVIDFALETQWGPKVAAHNFNYVFDPFGGPGGKSLVMTMTSKEEIGIRKQLPDRTLDIRHRNSATQGGLSLQNEVTNNRWGFFTAAGAGDLRLFFNNASRGFFDSVTGGYFPISDKRLKKDVTTLDPMMDKIMKLRPTSYRFNQQAASENKSLGFIAQEIQEVFPEVVKVQPIAPEEENGVIDLHAVNYSALVPVLVSGMQEQQSLIKAQQEEIAELKEMVQALTGAEKAGAAGDIQLNGNVLKQNSPNPFNSFTTISYELNTEFEGAAIYVLDLNGRQLRAFNNLERGQGEVTVAANDLEPGIYLYSLVVDGEEIATKRMVLTK